MSNIVEAKSSKDIDSDQIVLIDFYATWCPPCRAMMPVLEEFSKENNNVKVVKVDVEKHQELASQYNVSAIPKFVMLDKNKNIIDEVMGAVKKSKLEDMLQKATE